MFVVKDEELNVCLTTDKHSKACCIYSKILASGHSAVMYELTDNGLKLTDFDRHVELIRREAGNIGVMR